ATRTRRRARTRPGLRNDLASTGLSRYVQRNQGTMTRRSRQMAETEKAILAGGCFWGVQDLIRKLDGVTGTRVGYTGGDTPNATYRNHGSHADAIEILLDPIPNAYRQLPDVVL